MKTLQHTFNPSYFAVRERTSLINRFFAWCASQEKNRLLWVGLIIALHGCIITPLTMFTILISGNSMVFWILASAAMGIAIVANLAAQPTKVTIPLFVLSLVIDLFIVINCVVAGLNISSIYA